MTTAIDKNTTEMMPDEINAVKALVREFMEKIDNIDNEIAALKDDRKEVISEYKEKLDMKTLKLALGVIKLQRMVAHKDAYDLFIAALTDPAQ